MYQCNVALARTLWQSAVCVALMGFPALMPDALASSSGMTGRTNGGGGCATCHGASADSGIAVAVTGPASLSPGQTGAYSVTATKAGIANNLRMGVNIAASDGTLAVVAGQSMSLAGSELTHNVSVGALPFTANGSGSASYSFNYTMPAAAKGGTTHTLYSASHLQTVAGTQTTGWNYGTDFNVTTPATVPDAPPAVVAAAGNGQATLTISPSAANGSAITKYTVTATPAAGTDSNLNSPATTHLITGLSNGTSYTFTVTATNGVGTGPASAPSNSIIPTAVAPASVAINMLTNRIYTANYASSAVTVRDGLTGVETTIGVGTGPSAVAINMATNLIYVANYQSNNVTVIDGATNATQTIPVGTNPIALAVNPSSGRVYVANYNGANVTIIDPATNATSSLAAGAGPYAIAINPATNQIYVANYSSASVTIIDGASDSVVSTRTVGSGPSAIAVNVATNQIYVANCLGNSVSAINGATQAVTPVALAAGTNPVAISVNPVTNKIYVANFGNATISLIDGASNAISTIAAGASPRSIAVNAMTNRIYAANLLGSSLTVVDGSSNTASSVYAGSSPGALAINPLTSRVYIASFSNAAIKVVDDATYGQTTITVGSGPRGLAVNPATNQIYVANNFSNSVTVIDGVTRAKTTVAVGAGPEKVMVNPLTNKIYVFNSNDFTVWVIDGATNAASLLLASASDVAVNPVTNRVYVSTSANRVAVIDGATGSVLSYVPVGINPNELAINHATNKLYVANHGTGAVPCNANITVIDGYTGATTPISMPGCGPSRMFVNKRTNKIYVYDGIFLSVIDGTTNAATALTGDTNVTIDEVRNQVFAAEYGPGQGVLINATNNSRVYAGVSNVSTTNTGESFGVNPVTSKFFIPVYIGGSYYAVFDSTTGTYVRNLFSGNSPRAFATNPVTQRTYVSNTTSNNVYEIAEQQFQPVPLTTTITPLAGNVTTSPTPTLALTTGGAIAARRLYFQLDTWQGTWLPAAGTAPNFSASLPALTPGTHILYAFATDGQEGSVTTSGQQSAPFIGAIAAYVFTFAPQPANLVAAFSRKMHAGFGACDLTLDRTRLVTQAITVEPRQSSGTNAVVFKFDSPVMSLGSGAAQDGSGNLILISSITPQNNEVTVTLPPIGDRARAAVTLSNVNNSGGSFTVALGFLGGDINSNRATSAADINAIKSRFSPSLSAANCLFDLNLSGSIDSADLAIVKSRSGMVLP